MFLGLFRILKMVIYIKIYEAIPIFCAKFLFFPIFWDRKFLFSYFWTIPATWRPDWISKCLLTISKVYAVNFCIKYLDCDQIAYFFCNREKSRFTAHKLLNFLPYRFGRVCMHCIQVTPMPYEISTLNWELSYLISPFNTLIYSLRHCWT